MLTKLPATESGVDTSVENKFPGAEVKIGGQGAGDNRPIPVDEGGEVISKPGQPTGRYADSPLKCSLRRIKFRD